MIDTITIGDYTLNRLGLGTNRISDTDQGHEVLKKATELGINFIDTAHTYGGGKSEKAIGNALSPYADGLLIATKGGIPNGAKPAQLRAELEESLHRLKTDCITLYQLHRVDPETPLFESISALKQFQDEGLIKYIGLSEVTVEELEEANKIVPIVSVQNEYNVSIRHHEALVDYCTDNNIVFIPWFPLGGLRGDTVKVEQKLKDLASKYQATVQQLALAWLLKRSPMILPIPGTTSIEHLKDNMQAADIDLFEEDYTFLLNGN
jgi:pyridoxine 4-dehydrogenase